MELIQNLFRKKDRPKLQDRQEAIRNSEPFKRLQTKFARIGEDARSGLMDNQLTVGDLVDILDLYLEAAESDKRGACSTIARIINKTVPAEQLTSMAEELKKLSGITLRPSDLDRTHPLYSLSINLRLVMETGSEELSHYAGGIVIAELRDDSFEHTGKYALILTNRHQMDDGKPIRQIFEEVGLPVISNIR
jgi:hypothetical protein